MAPAECNMSSHELLRWRSSGDGWAPRVMPAIGVTCYAQTDAAGPPVLWQARARMRVLETAAWMSD